MQVREPTHAAWRISEHAHAHLCAQSWAAPNLPRKRAYQAQVRQVSLCLDARKAHVSQLGHAVRRQQHVLQSQHSQ